MNREIKFRVWDKNRKQLIYPDNKEYNYETPTDNGGLGFYLLTQNGFVLCNDGNVLDDWHENYIIQQYTGLKDKNSKDIYEGDILFADEYDNWVVVYDMGGFYITDQKNKNDKLSPLYQYTDCLIIGNILKSDNKTKKS